MERKKQNTSIKEELQKVQAQVNSDDDKKSDAWKKNPYVKAGMYLTGALALVWVSQFVFSAFEGAIRQYKKLRKTLNDK